MCHNCTTVEWQAVTGLFFFSGVNTEWLYQDTRGPTPALSESITSTSHCFQHRFNNTLFPHLSYFISSGACPTCHPVDVSWFWSHSTQNQWSTPLNIICIPWQLVLIISSTKPVVNTTESTTEYSLYSTVAGFDIQCKTSDTLLNIICIPWQHHACQFGREIHYYPLTLFFCVPSMRWHMPMAQAILEKLGRKNRVHGRNPCFWGCGVGFLSFGCKQSPALSS